MAKVEVKFKRGTKQELNAIPIVDGQLLYDTETGETFQDVGKKRISTGGSSGGTNDHSKLVNRDKPNQHSIDAITGLQEALDEKQPTGDYATKTELTEGLEGKQPKGDYALKSDVPKTAVLYTPQELTPEQQEQARKNIGATEGSEKPEVYIGPDEPPADSDYLLWVDTNGAPPPESGIVKDGLILWLDGKDRGPSPIKWRDKAQGIDFTMTNVTPKPSSVIFKANKTSNLYFDNAEGKYHFPKTGTFEIVIKNASGYQSVWFSPSDAGEFSVGPQGNTILWGAEGDQFFRFKDLPWQKEMILSLTSDYSYVNQSYNNEGRGVSTYWDHIPGSIQVNGRKDKPGESDFELCSIRIYNRQLTEQEILSNQKWDYGNYIATGEAVTLAELPKAMESGGILKYKGDNGAWVAISGGVANAADQITYDNRTSGLKSENVKEAIDELTTEAKKSLAYTDVSGVKIAVIGDSTLDIVDNPITQLVNIWGVEAQNLAVSASGFYAGDKYINQIPKIKSPVDVILVETGFNDTRQSLPIGTADDTGTKSLAGYANDFFDALITAYPTTPIICACGGSPDDRRPGTKPADDWIAVQKEICHRKKIPYYTTLFDSTVLKSWIPENRAEYFTDGAHQNAKGSKIMAKYYAKMIKENTLFGL